MFTEQLTQALGFCTEVDPQVLNNSNKTAGGVDMSKFKRALFIVNVGAVVGGGALTLQLIEDTQSSLATATNLAGANTSQAGFNTANKIVTFEARADQMSKRYLGLKVTETGSQNVNVCVIGFGGEAIQKPGSAQNAASVNTPQNVVA
jgi:hypothetical protein